MLAKIDDLRMDGGTQPRVLMDPDTIADYAEAMKSGAEFPPVVVFFDGKNHWLADGFHRVYAAQENGQTQIPVDRRTGSQRDAILFSCGANATHGRPRTNADKQQAIETLLRDTAWGKRTDKWISDACCVTDKTVAASRRRLESASEIPMLGRREARDGKTYKPRSAPPAAKPTPEPQSEREPAALDFEDAPESRPEPVHVPAPVTPARVAREQSAAPTSQPAKYSNMAVRDGAAKALKDVGVVWKFMGAADRDLFRREMLALMESE